ncbi:transcription termination/antitermination NusG family protein [Candidatus Ventrimonas sp. KK005]
MTEKENWYVLRTYEDQEYEALSLLESVIPKNLWSMCRIPEKLKVFRISGELRLVKDILFPGYLFIQTAHPKELYKELKKSREFPQFLYFGKNETGEEMIPVSFLDLAFLQNVCGPELQSPMGITEIVLGENRQILKANGVLKNYINQIVRLNLHKRFAVASIPLFNRSQTVLFGIRLEQDSCVVA